MKNSSTSSAKATPPSREGLTRRRFTLSGRSARLDPLTHAVRADLADIRLADQVFAPHYAMATVRIVARPASLWAERTDRRDVLATVQAGDVFELLDLVGDDGWGVAVRQGLVGYLDAAVLTPA